MRVVQTRNSTKMDWESVSLCCQVSTRYNRCGVWIKLEEDLHRGDGPGEMLFKTQTRSWYMVSHAGGAATFQWPMSLFMHESRLCAEMFIFTRLRCCLFTSQMHRGQTNMVSEALNKTLLSGDTECFVFHRWLGKQSQREEFSGRTHTDSTPI